MKFHGARRRALSKQASTMIATNVITLQNDFFVQMGRRTINIQQTWLLSSFLGEPGRTS